MTFKYIFFYLYLALGAYIIYFYESMFEYLVSGISMQWLLYMDLNLATLLILGGTSPRVSHMAVHHLLSRDIE